METETLWNRTKHTFEHILSESQKATERLIGSLEELGETAKARIEKARLERALLRKSAELGTRVHELAKQAALPDGSPPPVLEDDQVKALLSEIHALDADLEKATGELAKRDALRGDSDGGAA